MKKLVSMLLVLSLLLGAASLALAADAPVNLVWWVYTGSDAPIDAQLVQDAANAYSAEKIGVTVDIQYKTQEQLELAMGAGENYDMTFTCEWANNFNRNARDGMFADITDLLTTEAAALWASLDPLFWEAARIDGRIYAVPTKKDMGAEMFFRIDKDYYEGVLGMTIPDTMAFADIETYLAAFKADRPDEYPMMMGSGGLSGFTNFVQRVAGSTLVVPYEYAGTDKGTTIIPFYEYPALVERFELLHKWYGLGYIQPDAATTDVVGQSIPTTVRSGSAWFGYDAAWSRWAGHGVKISRYDGPFMSTATMQGAMQAINAGASDANKLAALKYMELVATDVAFRNILRYGVEGTHFNYNDQGLVVRTEQGSSNFSMDGFVFGSVAIATVEAVEGWDVDPNMWDKVYAGYADAIVSDLGSFSFNSESVDAERSAVGAVWEKYAAEVYTGTSDPAVVLPQIKAEMEAAGILVVQAEAQRQLDEYLAAQ